MKALITRRWYVSFHLVLTVFGAVWIWDAATHQIAGRALGPSPLFNLVEWLYAWTLITAITGACAFVDSPRLRTASATLWLIAAFSRGASFIAVFGASGVPPFALWFVSGMSLFLLSTLLEAQPHGPAPRRL